MSQLLEMEQEFSHEPVLERETLDLLVGDPDGLYLDATVGLGGHSEGILKRISAQGKLLGMDVDPEALHRAEIRLKPFGGRARLVHENFRDLGRRLSQEGFFPLAGALFDLGVSSMQLDAASRGFSFRGEGPLDMRLDPASPLTAGRIVNEWPAEQIELLLKQFGEEPEAARVARWIVERRSKQPFESTTDLGSFLESKLRRPASGIHPATRTFQALRIAVNRELENLTTGLESVLPLLKSGGRLAVITFHSLEDRIVKNILKSFVVEGQCRSLTASPVRPSTEEVDRNPRARSAKLRAVEKR